VRSAEERNRHRCAPLAVGTQCVRNTSTQHGVVDRLLEEVERTILEATRALWRHRRVREHHDRTSTWRSRSTACNSSPSYPAFADPSARSRTSRP